jgi:hypothetical protein
LAVGHLGASGERKGEQTVDSLDNCFDRSSLTESKTYKELHTSGLDDVSSRPKMKRDKGPNEMIDEQLQRHLRSAAHSVHELDKALQLNQETRKKRYTLASLRYLANDAKIDLTFVMGRLMSLGLIDPIADLRREQQASENKSNKEQ